MKIFSWLELELVAAELPPRYRAIPIFAGGTGLRPEEWIALERRDVDRSHRVASVQRVFANGKLSEYPKTDRSRRRVPLRMRVLERSNRCRRVSIRPFFSQALVAATSTYTTSARVTGRPRFVPLALTIAALRSEAHLRDILDRRWHVFFALARRMGTSLEMIDKTYGHLAPDADEYELGLLDAFDARISAARGHLLDTAD